MRAVSVAVRVLPIAREVLEEGRPPAEVRVCRVDARVNDIRAGALAAGSVVNVVGRVFGAVRDSSQAPGCVGLGGEGGGADDGVLFDIGDLSDVMSTYPDLATGTLAALRLTEPRFRIEVKSVSVRLPAAALNEPISYL